MEIKNKYKTAEQAKSPELTSSGDVTGYGHEIEEHNPTIDDACRDAAETDGKDIHEAVICLEGGLYLGCISCPFE